MSRKTLQIIRFVGILIIIFLGIHSPALVIGQSGTADADSEAIRHLEIGRLYEQAREWDKALSEYHMAASIAKAPENYQAAINGLQRVLALKQDPIIKIQQDFRSIGYGFASVAIPIGLVAIIGFVALLLFSYFYAKSAALVVMPFKDYSRQSQDNGLAIAEDIVNALDESRFVLASDQASEIMLTGQNELPFFRMSHYDSNTFPDFSMQQYETSLVKALTSLGSVKVGQIDLPLGSLLGPLVRWVTAGRRRITGSIQKYGNVWHITARLEEGRSHKSRKLWRQSQEISSDASVEQLESLAKSLAFQILFGLNSGWGAKSSRSLANYTHGLYEIRVSDMSSARENCLERAVEYFDRAVELDPAYFFAKYDLASCQAQLGRFSESISIFKSLQSNLLSKAPDFSNEINFNLGVAYYHLAQRWSYDFAEAEFNRVIQNSNLSDKDSKGKQQAKLELFALAHCGLAFVNSQRILYDKNKAHIYLQEVTKHIEIVRKTLEGNLDIIAFCHYALGLAFYHSEDYKSSVDAMCQAIDTKIDLWRAYIYRADAEMRLGDINASILALEQVTTMNPSLEYAQYKLGQALLEHGSEAGANLEKAALAFSKAKMIAPAHNALGRIHAQAGNHDKALEEFREAIRLNSRNADALIDLVWYTLEAGHFDSPSLYESRNLARRAVDLESNTPKEGRARAVLGRVYVQLGELGQAEKELGKSISLSPNNPQPYYFLAKTLVEQHRLDDAHDILVKLLQLTSADLWKEQAIVLMKEIEQQQTK